MAKRTVLTVHNFYREPGGEDVVFETESALLEGRGHRVARYEDRNERITNGAMTSLAAVWSLASYRKLRALAIDEKPDVAHFHNTFPLVSPAAYYALRRERVPIIQKLSNFRLICPGATLLRDGIVCEECVEKRSLAPAILHRCYRESRAATAAVCAMIATHRLFGTWNRVVDLYLAPTEFTRRKFVDAGFPEDRIVVKQHAIHDDPGVGAGRGNYALFVGRLSHEKGVRVLADAWRTLPDIPLRVAGDGPLRQIDWPAGVEPLGHQSREQVQVLMRDAAALIVPSICYEIGPLTVLEAFACGTPVIASDLGSMAERVDHHRTGLLFRANDPEELARHVRWAFDNPERMQEMRTAARREFEQKYTADANYKRLIEIYELAIESARRRHRDRRAERMAAAG